jgi:quinol-cytochrome oxidoreductase complex cytochrome b subunit
MWRPDTLWLEIAVVMSIFAVGSILFGHFEEHKPKWKRLLKVVLVVGIVLLLSTTLGRAWAFGFLVLPLLGAAVVHLWWLPKHGINGWTGEPKERYLELVRKR